MAKKITTTTTVETTIEDNDPPHVQQLSPVTLGLSALVLIAFMSGFSRQQDSATVNNINTGDGAKIYIRGDN